MKWLISEDMLDKDQKAFLDRFLNENSNVHVQGFPGSGKTILLVYAVRRLRQRYPGCRILFVEFTHSLIKMISAALRELVYDGMRENPVNVVTYYDFEENYACNKQWDYIICDEVQDISTAYLAKMKKAAKRVVVGGDANQSIYKEDPKKKLPTCKPRDIEEQLSPQNTKLSIMHRLGKRVANAINAILPKMNVLSGRTNMSKTNMQIRVWKATDKNHETALIMDDAVDAIGVNKTVAILLPTHKMIWSFVYGIVRYYGKPKFVSQKSCKTGDEFEGINEYLEKLRIPVQIIVNNSGEVAVSENKIVIMTYHGVKGLDFDKVFLPRCNEDLFIKHNEPEEYWKILLMVAMTRCREDLYITYTRNLYPDIGRIGKDDALFCDKTVQENESLDDLDIFGF